MKKPMHVTDHARLENTLHLSTQLLGASEWLIILISSIIVGQSPVPLILFLLGLVLVMNGLIIKFKPITIGGIILFIFVCHHFT